MTNQSNTSGGRLTEAQRRVLENLEADRKSDHGFSSGRSTAGGLTGTFLSLRRRGLITTFPTSITDLGRAALQEQKK